MLLQVKEVSKRYDSLEVLSGVSLEVDVGERVVIIGRSGSGKSTLLRCIAGLEGIDSGSIIFDGEVVDPGSRRIRAIREQIGFVFQSFNLFPHLTALENVSLGLRVVKRLNPDEVRARTLASLEQVGLLDKINTRPAELSGGQQQRVAIARAMAMQPKMVLFDEPTSALDPELVREVLLVIRDLATAGMTMILVTHEVGFARRVSDRIVFLDEARLVAQGAPEYMLGDQAPEAVRQFLLQTEHEV